MTATVVPQVTTDTIGTTDTTGPVDATQYRRVASPTRRLVQAEFRLLRRDPLTMTFVLAFPVVTMLIIGGSFGRVRDEAFENTDPAHWYVASYLTVVIAATGLIMVPVHIASYRERGVLRRFTAAGFPRWSFFAAQVVTGISAVVAAGLVLLAVALPVYGLPAVGSWWRVLLGLSAGSVGFISLGVLLGTLIPSARAAQAVGLLLFFPSFLLGAGGPPPNVMGSGLRAVADYLPLTLVTRSVREPWLGIGDATGPLIAVVTLALLATVVSARRMAL